MAEALTPHEAYKRAEYAIITLTTCPGYYFGDGPKFSDLECKYYKRAYKLGYCRKCWRRYMIRNGIKEL